MKTSDLGTRWWIGARLWLRDDPRAIAGIVTEVSFIGSPTAPLARYALCWGGSDRSPSEHYEVELTDAEPEQKVPEFSKID